MGYDAGLHLYAYVGNDPLNATDPSGENPFAGAAVGCAVTGPACPAGAAVGAAVGIAVAVGAVIVINEISNDDEPTDESANDDSTPNEKARKRITQGAKPNRVTSRGTRIFDKPPSGEKADDIMDDIKGMPGAETTMDDKDSDNPVDIVTLPDGSRVIDRNSSSRPPKRTIETQNSKGRTQDEVRFPDECLKTRSCN